MTCQAEKWGKIIVEIREVPVYIKCKLCDSKWDIDKYKDFIMCPECERRVIWACSPLDQRKHLYLEHNGINCLHCGSPDIEVSAPIQIEGEHGEQEVGCNTCGKFWVDEYILCGVREEK